MNHSAIIFVFTFFIFSPLSGVAQQGEDEPKGYSKVVVENCHEDQVEVRIWIAENGNAWADRAAWKDRGLLESQWSDAECPAGGEARTIDLNSGTFVVVKAIDSRCGGATPLNTLANCHVLTTRKIRGDAGSPHVYTARVEG